MELDLQNPLTSYEGLQYDSVTSLFSDESDHTPCFLSLEPSDLRFSIRRNVFSLIYHVKLSYDLDPFLVYLSVNYVDRFLAKQKTLEKRPWIAQILVVASLSLAAKMRNADLSISLSHLQREEGFEFDTQSIHRMEKILLATLQWRMHSITPFSFLRYFLSLFEIEDCFSAQCLKHRASDIIFKVQHEVKLLEYKPSIIAASALLCSIEELTTPLTFSSLKAAISSCQYVNNDELLECVGVMQEMTKEGYERNAHATASGTLMPVSVLDGQGTSSISEEDAGSSEFPDRDDKIKRLKLNGLRDNTTLQISQIHQC